MWWQLLLIVKNSILQCLEQVAGFYLGGTGDKSQTTRACPEFSLRSCLASPWTSLRLFNHLPHHPESAAHLLISDGTHAYGFRKCPDAIADHIRRRCNLFCFAYMDDFISSHPNPKYLAAISHSCIQCLQTYRIRINYDKLCLNLYKTFITLATELLTGL